MILGFYSAQADLELGHSVWTTPSGNQVTVTEVRHSAEAVASRTRRTDEVERGEIVACVHGAPCIFTHEHCVAGVEFYRWNTLSEQRGNGDAT